MNAFVPPGYMARAELLELAGKALFKDCWFVVPTKAERLQAVIKMKAERADAQWHRRWSRTDEELFKLRVSLLQEPTNAAMHNRVVTALRAALCTGVIPAVVVDKWTGLMIEIQPHFWHGDGPAAALDADEATVCRGHFQAFRHTGRMLFKRAEAEAWLARSPDSSPQDHYPDHKLLADMHALITSKGMKRFTAARQVAERAPGSRELVSRAKRLDAKYKKLYQS